VHKHIAAPANIAGAGQGYRKREPCGDRGVDGIAALAEDFGSHLGGDAVLAYHHSTAADHRVVDLAVADDVAAGSL